MAVATRPSIRTTPAADELGDRITAVILEFQQNRPWIKSKDIRLALRRAAANSDAGTARGTIGSLAVGVFLVAVLGAAVLATDASLDRPVVLPMFIALLVLGVILVVLLVRR